MSDDKLKIAVNRPFQAGSDKYVMVNHNILISDGKTKKTKRIKKPVTEE